MNHVVAAERCLQRIRSARQVCLHKDKCTHNTHTHTHSHIYKHMRVLKHTYTHLHKHAQKKQLTHHCWLNGELAIAVATKGILCMRQG
jgi:ABC-type Zn2+ transport system substrate-binding protein/surface adhesin